MVIIEHQLGYDQKCRLSHRSGPEAGEKGGYIVCKGTPEQVAKNSNSLTGFYLRACF